MMNTSEVAIRCGEHAFTRLQKLLPQQDRLLPKIYQTEDDQYIIYWDSIHWFESSDKREAELVRAFNRAFDYLEECPFDQDGNINLDTALIVRKHYSVRNMTALILS